MALFPSTISALGSEFLAGVERVYKLRVPVRATCCTYKLELTGAARLYHAAYST